MSLPTLLAARPHIHSTASKLRGGAGPKHTLVSGAAATSTSLSNVGKKRTAACLNGSDVLLPTWELFDTGALDDALLDSPRRLRVVIVGLSPLGSQLAEFLASKPGSVQLGLCEAASGTSPPGRHLHVLPGVAVLHSGNEACSWADLIVMCGSYEESAAWLRQDGIPRWIKGKAILQLTNGSPQEALALAGQVKHLKAEFLDACLLSECASNVFGRKGACMMVSGSKVAWEQHSEILRSAAPASFYGGPNAEWANTVSAALCTVFSSVAMGLQQAQAIAEHFKLPQHVLPSILATRNYMGFLKGMVSNPPQALHSLPRRSSLGPMSSASAVSGSSQGSLQPVQPTLGSAEWHDQLLRIRSVCQQAGVEHSLIDGMLAAGAASQPALIPTGSANGCGAVPQLAGDLAAMNVCKTDSVTNGPTGGSRGFLGSLESLDLVDTAGLLYPPTEAMFHMPGSLGKDCLAAAWAP